MNWSGCANTVERPLMLKRPLCTSAETNLRDRVLGEVEKKSFYCFGRQKGTQQDHALKNPNPEGVVRSFIAMAFLWLRR